MPRTKWKSATRGSSITEFAIVSTILFLVMFGLFEFCRMALVYSDLSSASRIAVRYAITHGADRTQTCNSSNCGSGDGTAGASDICGSSGVLTTFAKGPLDTSKLVCTETGLGGEPGSTVKITVSYSYDPWFNVIPTKVTLSSTSEGIITY